MASVKNSARLLRVAHVINCLPRIGGAERLILDLAECSAVRPVPVITWWGTDNSLLEQDLAGSLELIALRPFSLTSLRRAREALKQADVVHLHLFPTLYLAPFICIPTVYTEHSTWNRRRDHAWLRRIERWIYGRVNKVIAISEATGSALEGWLGDVPPRMAVIPNGIRLSRFDGGPRTLKMGDIKLGMAGRFAQEKDHATLIRAMAMLPASYRLILAGDGPLKKELEDLGRQLGVDQRVEFTGVITDMPAYYRNIDVYVQSSVAEGFSLVAAEAMASGLPTLGSDIDGLRSTIGRSELLFRPGDPASLAQRVRNTCDTQRIYEELAAYCASRAKTLDIRITAESYRQAYSEVVDVAGDVSRNESA